MKLLSSERSRIDGTTGHMVNYLPVYEHKGSTLKADSGYLYTDELNREYFDAFGQVVITQPDGSMIFANKLHYAAEPQLATLTGNVRMVDGESTLTTNYLTYNMRTRVGTYTGGGRIVNQADTITSEKAWYFNQTQDAYFRHDVIVRTPDVHIFTDTMRYNSEQKTTFFYGPTNLQGKDGENLYTEEGYYQTETELAEFYKNNLYTETTRFLRGDTLYYDGKLGTGRALGNVLFVDTADQFFLEGRIGLYQKEEESLLMTGEPLLTMLTEEDSGRDSVYMTADTLYSRVILLRDYVPLEFRLDREGGALEEESSEFDAIPEEPGSETALDSIGLDSIGLDSIALDALARDSLASDTLRSTLPIPPVADSSVVQLDSVGLRQLEVDLVADSILRQEAPMPIGGEADSLMNQAVASIQVVPDSLSSDTTKTRIIKAYKNVRLFKSDLQAVGDSVYYGYPDSMMRFYGAPMAWTQGSQLSGDTLYLQIKNEKIDNMLVVGRVFIANTKGDSTKFNQIKGRKITGFFMDGELERVFVDGNAESIAFRENKAKTGFTEMHYNRSSRIKIMFANDELTHFIPIGNVEGTIYPVHLLTQDQEILDGFIWKPGDRPRSKADLLIRKRVREAPEEIEAAEPPPPTNDEDPPAQESMSDHKAFPDTRNNSTNY